MIPVGLFCCIPCQNGYRISEIAEPRKMHFVPGDYTNPSMDTCVHRKIAQETFPEEGAFFRLAAFNRCAALILSSCSAVDNRKRMG